MLIIKRTNKNTDGLIDITENGLTVQYNVTELREILYTINSNDNTDVTAELRIAQRVYSFNTDALYINGVAMGGKTADEVKDTFTKLFSKSVAGGGDGTTDNTTAPYIPYKDSNGEFSNSFTQLDEGNQMTITQGLTHVLDHRNGNSNADNRMNETSTYDGKIIVFNGLTGFQKIFSIKKLGAGNNNNFEFSAGWINNQFYAHKDDTTNVLLIGDVDKTTCIEIDLISGKISFISQSGKYHFSNIPQFESMADALSNGLSSGMIYKTNFHVNGAPVLAIVE